MNELFNEWDDLVNSLFKHLSDMFDPGKNTEILRLAQIEAEIKKVQSEDE